jgi:maltooligosyltrehalose trehalohydrolase
VILDVVYNHFGPDGNYLPLITGGQITNDRHHTAWGAAVNYDAAGSAAVRDFILQNALYWAHEYHVDGLRIDATHAMVDDSATHILQEIATALHALPRPRIVIAEDERNERRLVLDERCGGFGLDAVWADDLHHSLRRLTAGDDEGYFASYRGTIDEVVETLRKGWLYEGQWSPHHHAARGTPADGIPPRAFVHCLQNHDQVGNRACGDRIHHSVTPAAYRALSALLLLSPYTPLLWMGQEWAASSPFQFFTDFPGDLGRLLTEGRRREFQHFAAFEGNASESVPDPQAESTFLASRLCWREREHEPHKSILTLYRELLALRASDPALQDRGRTGFEVHALGDDALALRRDNGGASMLVILQLGNGTRWVAREHSVWTIPADRQWEIVLSTEENRFGGSGSVAALTETEHLIVTAPGALVLRAVQRRETQPQSGGNENWDHRVATQDGMTVAR